MHRGRPRVHHASQGGASDSKSDTEKPEPGIVPQNMPPADAQQDIDDKIFALTPDYTWLYNMNEYLPWLLLMSRWSCV